MSHTRTSAKTAAKRGSFAFECRDYAGQVFRAQDGFATAQEADRAAERAERDMMARHMSNQNDMAAYTQHTDLSDAELLAELGL